MLSAGMTSSSRSIPGWWYTQVSNLNRPGKPGDSTR